MASSTGDRRPLLSFLRVQEDFEKQLLRLLAQSAAAVEKDLREMAGKRGVGAVIAREQRLLVLKAVRERQAELWEKVGHTVQAGRLSAAAAAVDTMLEYDNVLLRAVTSAAERDALRKSAQAQAARGLDNAVSRMTLSKVPLSQQVYRTQALANSQVERVINQAIVKGVSARDLAAEVRQFIKPDVSGGVRYAASRLGRTELNNAFHATQVSHAARDPFVTGMKWEISGSHKKPDECDDYASMDAFKPADVPRKPHPQCLCYLVPETVSRAQFIDAFARGDYDSYLDT